MPTVWLAATVAFATSFAPAHSQHILSANETALLHIDAALGRWTIEDANGIPLWSFSREVWMEEAGISDDGGTVIIVPWKLVVLFNLELTAVERWTVAGKQTLETVGTLAPHPTASGMGPIGPWWRRWREPVQWDASGFEIATTDLWRYRYGWDGAILDKTLSPAGVLIKVVGWAGLGSAVALMLFWSRNRSRRSAIAALGPVLTATWVGVSLAPLPVLGGALTPLDGLLWLAALLMAPIAAFAAIRTAWPRTWLALAVLGGLEALLIPIAVEVVHRALP